MEEVLTTARLRLTLMNTVEEGSQDLEWAHVVRSDPGATVWSIFGQSETIHDTQKVMRNAIPALNADAMDKRRCQVTYTIHTPGTDEHSKEVTGKKEVIGQVSIRAKGTLPIAESLSIDDGPETGILKMEIGYSLITTAWSRGYATEAVMATLSAFKRAESFWAPFKKIYIEAIVHPDNPASCRVLEKAGFRKVGLHEWEAERIVLAGALRENRVLVYGIWLVA